MEPISFHELYVAHSAAVYRYALLLSGQPSEADEITAEVFFRAFAVEAIRQQSARAYLCTIARNLFHDERRRQKRAASLDEQDNLQFPAAATQEAQAELSQVQAALARIPELYRIPLQLFASAGLSYEEIAVELGLTAQVVKIRIHRARQKLAEILRRP